MPRGRKSQLHGLQFKFACEWVNCEQEFSELPQLKQHQLDHFKVLREEAAYSSSPMLCGICQVALDLDDVDSVERHSCYHAWSIYLRAKGRQLQERNDWPPCLLDTSSRNIVPELPTKFECGWEYCDYRTNDISDFFAHVFRHSDEYTDSRYPAGVELKCLWENCSYVGPRLKNLTSHLVTHTQDKRVACPACGLLLADFSKLENHLKRQQVQLVTEDPENAHWHPSVQPVQCTRCYRLFATERLLISHMRRHINTVKCPQCDMTVFGRSGLDRHILFRHTTEKPFACEQCEYRCKTPNSLTRHVELRHKKRAAFGLKRIIPTSCSMPASQPITDLDNSQGANSTGGSFVLGPLAAAGAIGLLKSSESNQSDPLASLPSIENRPFQSNSARSYWIRCSFPGCKFKTTKEVGFQVHVGRKHVNLGEQVSNEDGTLQPQQQPTSNSGPLRGLRVPLYACHLCPVVKRRGFDLSKHLMRDHQLTRPSGHSRFTYAIADDGHYRLQLTRLDTVSVAAALLGEQVVNKLLSNHGGSLCMAD